MDVVIPFEEIKMEPKPTTVSKFIENILVTYPDKIGSIDVIAEVDKEVYHCKYDRGKIISSNIDADILVKEITNVAISGKWPSLNNYTVYIKEDEK